jgi:MFS transporter, DHA3 family, macrolide efflux protein
MEEVAVKEKPAGRRDLLRNRNFRYLWTGQVVSDFGDSLTNLALLITINLLTGSTAALATMLIVLTIPQVTFGLVAGVYVDRWDRKRIMILSDLIRGVLVLGFVLVSSANSIWLLYVIGFLQASIGTLFTPARSALLPGLVEKSALLPANSISQTSRVVFGVLGTGAAGVLIGLFNVTWPAFTVDALTFFCSVLLVSRIKAPAYKPELKAGSGSLRAVLGQLGDGIKLIAHSRMLTGTLVAAGVTMLGLGAVNVLIVPLMLNEMQLPATWFGLMEFAQTAAMVLSGTMVVALAARLKPATIISIALVLLGVMIALIAPANGVIYLIAVLFGVGLLITPLQASISTISQTAVENNMLGRMGAALSTLVSTASLLSMALAGVCAGLIGLRNVFVLSGAVVVVAGIASALVFGMARKSTPVTIEPATADNHTVSV